MKNERLNYEESCGRLQPKYLDDGAIPSMLSRIPRYDDAEPGVSFFRTYVGKGDDLSGLSLPRTFFGRSEIDNISFRNTDLSESVLCWNDFVAVDFSDASLARADLRASLYTQTNFAGADLRGADMRLSTFEDCSFDGADMTGSMLSRRQGDAMALSAKQRTEIAWTESDGDEPEGG